MAKLTKKQKAFQGKVVAQKLYPVLEALTLAKATATAKPEGTNPGPTR